MEEVEEIQGRIKNLKDELKELQYKEKLKRKNENRKVRLKSNGNGKSNTPIRVSNDFADRIEVINDKREENGLDRLSGPKITDLILRHRSSWPAIQEDIIGFNTNIEVKEGGIFPG